MSACVGCQGFYVNPACPEHGRAARGGLLLPAAFPVKATPTVRHLTAGEKMKLVRDLANAMAREAAADKRPGWERVARWSVKLHDVLDGKVA